MKWKIIIILIILSAIGYGVWKSEIFQREVFPRKYWSKQIEDLEHSIKLDEYMLRNTRIELRKQRIAASLEVAQEINMGTSLLGMGSEEARKMALEKVQGSIAEQEELLKVWQEQLDQDKEYLERAKRELAKHK